MKLTIKQFQELYFIAKSTDHDIDKSIKMVGCITGKTPEQVEKINMLKFNFLCSRITKAFEITGTNMLKTEPVKMVRCKGRTYRLHYRIDKQPNNAGKYIEAISFGVDVIENLHKIMATIAEPVRWHWGKMKWMHYSREHSEIAQDFEALNFEVAYHAAVFFYTLYRVSMQIIQPYLVMEIVKNGGKKEEAEELLSNLINNLDGLIMPRWSANLKTYLLNRYGS